MSAGLNHRLAVAETMAMLARSLVKNWSEGVGLLLVGQSEKRETMVWNKP
jgi:hypothetical protein